MRWILSWMTRIAALPFALRAVLVGIAMLHGIGLSWGMPASDAWDNDGIAPRDFLPGLAATYTPGEFFTYPPLHLALLGLLTAPVTIAAAVRAGSSDTSVVLREIIAPPYMTAMAMTARVVALLMSLGIALAVAKIAAEIAPEDRRRHAPAFAAAVVGVGISMTYYSHTSNLDVPYLFWASLAGLALVRAIARRRPRGLRAFAVLAALAIASKDQAYAVFLGAAPVVIGAWAARDVEHRRAVLREAVASGLVALVLLLAIDGALTNPTGFRARLAFLGGSASQDYATYARGPAGWFHALLDTGKELRAHYPAPLFFGGLYVLGGIDVRRRPDVAARIAAYVPLAFAVSFTLFFNLAARRVEERFTLPQVVFLGAYAGIGLARLASARALRWLVRGAIAVAMALATFASLELDVNLLLEPRYDVESFLATNARPNDVVELHGINVYLPRIRQPSDVVPGPSFVRVGPSPAARRSPIPGLTEIQAPYSAIRERAPRFIVISECWVWRYLPDAFGEIPEGRIRPLTQARDADDEDARRFYEALFGGLLPYRLARESRFRHSVFGARKLHASVSCPVYTFELEHGALP